MLEFIYCATKKPDSLWLLLNIISNFYLSNVFELPNEFDIKVYSYLYDMLKSLKIDLPYHKNFIKEGMTTNMKLLALFEFFNILKTFSIDKLWTYEGFFNCFEIEEQLYMQDRIKSYLKSGYSFFNLTLNKKGEQ